MTTPRHPLTIPIYEQNSQMPWSVKLMPPIFTENSAQMIETALSVNSVLVIFTEILTLKILVTPNMQIYKRSLTTQNLKT